MIWFSWDKEFGNVIYCEMDEHQVAARKYQPTPKEQETLKRMVDLVESNPARESREMTNFEKWKAGLTEYDIIENGCKRCPLYWDCEEHWATSACCQKVKGWVNAEAEEDEK